MKTSKSSFILMVDISGFTRFVDQTAIEHSSHIIAELLELIIDADELGLSVAEVEGDAIFFYSHQKVPSREALLKQVEKTFIAFHAHLQLYEKRRVCHCGACSTAPSLTLKFIAHACEFTFISVKGNSKPYGKGVIIAHRLLKNDVPVKDYVLFSEHLLSTWQEQQSDGAITSNRFIPLQTMYQDLGSINYVYRELGHLKELIPELEDLPVGGKTNKPIIHEMELPFPIDYVYQILIDMDQRSKWIDGAEEVNFDPKDLNRLGAKHQCIVNGQEIEFETVTDDFGEGRWVYGEQTSSVPLVRESTNYFILDEITDGRTKLTVETHFKKHPIFGWLLIPLFKYLVSKGLGASLIKFKNWLGAKEGKMKIEKV